ncbi:MAG: DNA-binding response regulator [Acidobacteria bacterium]|nr:MAG: DNA-binding response regulator [Acidobacteriota bacterium]
MSRKLRLLICDDHALFRAGMKAVLQERNDVDVVGEAGDGQVALDEVERLRPDVVLMDIEMPRLNGFDATRRITQAHKDVKVLILTMYAEEQLVARCMEAGASGYVLKDVPVSQLTYAIEAVARGERYLSPRAVETVLDDQGQRLERGRTKYDLLTDREREVLKLLADGLSVKEIATRLERSAKTVEVHKYNLMRKLGVHDRSGLVKYAIAHRLVQLPVFDDLVEPRDGSKEPV